MKMISANMMSKNELPMRRSGAFTLVELLIVISIIGVLAGFIVAALGPIKKLKAVNTAKAELAQIQTALEAYKGKYGVYPPSNENTNSLYTPLNDRAQFNQLFYELSGTTQGKVNGVDSFITLDGAYSIPVTDVTTAYKVGGFINCSKGSGEDAVPAKNFLLSLSTKQVADLVTNNAIHTTVLVTAVGGPDDNYRPFGQLAININPVRYLYPGVNNPLSYDLWVQLVVSGKTNLVCNWTKNVQVNTSYP
ncbi:MAG TPA: type II secretion system protein [Verrucomicrobiae bacterium]|nr:type II secretion system protein [Verrucomicrobiae bacterium]